MLASPRQFSKNKKKSNFLKDGQSFKNVSSVICDGDIYYPGDVICTMSFNGGQKHEFWRVPINIKSATMCKYEIDGSCEIKGNMRCDVVNGELNCENMSKSSVLSNFWRNR